VTRALGHGTDASPRSAEVCVVIPYYRGANFIGPCVASLLVDLEPGGVGYRVLIVDNDASRGGATARDRDRSAADAVDGWSSASQALCAALETLPDEARDVVRVVGTRPAIGFGRAVNVGVYRAIADGARVVVVLNQDAVVSPGSVKHLYEAVTSPDGPGVAGPLHMNLGLTQIAPFFIRNGLAQSPRLVTDALNGTSRRSWYSVSMVSGACFAVRADVVREVGLFDPIFHMYGEDNEWMERVRAAGFGVGLVPDARIGHAHGNTGARGAARARVDAAVRQSATLRSWLRSDENLGMVAAREAARRVLIYGRHVLNADRHGLRAQLEADGRLWSARASLLRAATGDVRSRIDAAIAEDTAPGS